MTANHQCSVHGEEEDDEGTGLYCFLQD